MGRSSIGGAVQPLLEVGHHLQHVGAGDGVNRDGEELPAGGNVRGDGA